MFCQFLSRDAEDHLTLSHRATNLSAVGTSSEMPEPGLPNGSAYPEILTTAMAADMLHVHVEYLRRMVREDRVPAHRFPGGREIRFLRDELIQWVADQPGHDRSPSSEERADA
jgi:excisionase family DNA binding protein